MKPTKEQVLALLERILENPRIIRYDNMGELLGMKLTDSLLPKMVGEPNWDYEGLLAFCNENGIESSDTIQEALDKIK